MNFIHNILEIIGFNTNPYPWMYVFIATPLLLGSLVRLVHYWPIRSIDGQRSEDNLIWTCAASVFWGPVAIFVMLYAISNSFVWTVRKVWPTPVIRMDTDCDGEICDGGCNNPHCEERQRLCLASHEVERIVSEEEES